MSAVKSLIDLYKMVGNWDKLKEFRHNSLGNLSKLYERNSNKWAKAYLDRLDDIINQFIYEKDIELLIKFQIKVLNISKEYFGSDNEKWALPLCQYSCQIYQGIGQ